MLYGYGRVSTDMQDCSVEDQRLQLQTWAGDREIILCIDEDVSGKKRRDLKENKLDGE